MNTGIIVISILVGVVAIVIPFVLGIIRCLTFLIERPGKVATTSAFTPQYDHILDITEDLKSKATKLKNKDYAEILSIGIAPILGILVSFFFGDMKIPFDPAFSISTITFISIGYISYWASRTKRNKLPLLINLLLPYGIMIGVLCYIFLFIHFISLLTAMAMLVLSFIAFPLVAPLPASLFALRQFKVQLSFNTDQLTINVANIPEWYRLLDWKILTLNLLLLGAIILLIQFTLLLFGQPLDGFWLAFRGSEGFLFSLNDSIF